MDGPRPSKEDPDYQTLTPVDDWDKDQFSDYMKEVEKQEEIKKASKEDAKRMPAGGGSAQ